MASDEALALWIPSPFFSSRDGATPRWLILHGTAGGTTAEDIGAWFQNPAAQVSAHYVIGRDGTIVQCVAESNAAWANGPITGPAGVSGDGVHHDSWWDDAPLWSGLPNPNPVTISIEHLKPHDDNSDSLTEPQRASSFALIKHICQRNNIPMRKADASGGIIGHYSMDPVNRSRCPGPYPWDALWAYLRGGETDMPLQLTDPFAATFFQDAGGKGWHCTRTNMYIGGAILDFYRSIQGAPRLPLTNEIKDVAGHPEVAYQIFEAGMIVFDPNHVIDAPTGFDRCYLVKFGNALVQNRLVVPVVQPLKDQLNTALAQVKALQQQLVVAQNSMPIINDLKVRLTQIHNLSDTTEEFLK